MKKFVTLIAMIAFLASMAANAFGDDRDRDHGRRDDLGNPGVAPLNSMPYGKSYGEWSKEWWLYVMPMPNSVNPFAYGTDGTIGQSGHVWFLGGSFVGANLIREITIPENTALFFPIANAECSTLESGDWHGDNEAELRACANGWTDRQIAGEWGPMYCVVDGVALQHLAQYRCETPLISITIPATPAGDNNSFGVPVTEPTPLLSVGDGVYIFLYPLPLGTHTLEFAGVHYTIQVVKPPRVFPPHSHPYGKSYSEWLGDWYLYAFPKALDVNPFADGTDPALGQSGRVWFLGGSFVTDTAIREITVPHGRALFVSLLNAECSTIEAPPFYGRTPAELRECAETFVDGAAGVWCSIDGVAVDNLEAYRVQTPLLHFTVPDNNILLVPGPARGKSVGDGYNVMIKPLSVGEHIIHFGGMFPAFNYTEDILYRVTVVPAADSPRDSDDD